MRNNTLIKWGVGYLALALMLSCGPKKRVASSEGHETVLSGAARAGVMEQIVKQQLHFDTFHGRAKSSLTINRKAQYDVTANIRLIRGEAIWISMTALIGMEVARVFITPDSIKIINRLESTYINKPFAYLDHFTGSGLDFSSLERLLVGDVVDAVAQDGSGVWRGADGYLLQRETDNLQYAVRVGADYQTNYLSISAPARDLQLEAFYGDYQEVGGNSFPNRMELSITTSALALQTEMGYTKVAFDEKVELPFTIPSRYTEVQ